MRAEGADAARLPVGAWGDAPVLVLEASTPEASAAVVRGGTVVAAREAVMKAGAGDALLPAVDAVLGAAGVRPGALAAVVCGAGPGGFTSLRIAAALAKGMAHATGVALAAVPSLALAAAGAAARAPGDAERRWLVTLDALRGARYAARVTTAGDQTVVAYAYLGVLDGHALDATLVAESRDGVAHVDANAHPARAADAVRCAWERVDLDGWEPLYGRAAEAQVRWEAEHGRPLGASR